MAVLLIALVMSDMKRRDGANISRVVIAIILLIL